VRKHKDLTVDRREVAPEESEVEDHILIRRFLDSGDPRTFQELVERHLPSIRRLLYTLFNGQREEMEDAEQEIVLSLFRGLKDFRFRSSFRTYFYRLARNRGIDCLRRKRSRERTLARVKLSLWNSEPEGPEQQALRREEIESLLGFFRTLPLKDRQLILMKDVDDFSIEQIAAILGVPPGTVKSRLHRAREKLLASARRGR
jgi:RNA polymerase sigma-70 factor (ECF subfamily)